MLLWIWWLSSLLRLALQQVANLHIHLYKLFPAQLLRIVHLVLPVDPANIWTGLVNQAALVGITVMPASPIPPVQVPCLFRQVHIAATKPALRTGKRR
jgi:hypothetical protein